MQRRQRVEFTRDEAYALVGKSVMTERDWPSVPRNTIGRIVGIEPRDPARECWSVAIEWQIRDAPKALWYDKPDFSRIKVLGVDDAWGDAARATE